MTPAIAEQLLTLAMGRRLQIAQALMVARSALPAGAPGIGALDAERRVNEQAIEFLEAALRPVAA